MTSFNEENRFGSAAFATEADLGRAGVLGNCGIMLGFKGKRLIRVDGDAPLITFGGAGTGKLRDLGAYTVCGCRSDDGKWFSPTRMFINDPRGELAAISIQNLVRLGKRGYFMNAYGLHGLPQHRVNPLDMLRPGSKTLIADTKILVGEMIVLSGSQEGAFFELRARQWLGALVLYHVLRYGYITLPALYELVNAMQDTSEWTDIAEGMFQSPFAEVRRTVLEMNEKYNKSPKEYSAFMSEIIKSLDFLSDPYVYEMFNGADFSLEVICQFDCNIYLMIPAEYAEILATVTRLIMGATMLYKQRHPEAPRVTFFIDEAATLKRSESLLGGYTFGRGMGIRMWSFWQNLGQISRNFGPDAVESFMGSAQVRQFIGTRDIKTAKTGSEMIGKQTLEYDAELLQRKAKVMKAQIIRQLLAGGDPIAVGQNYRLQAFAAADRAKQSRDLLAPDEMLRLKDDEQILFISGLNLNPVLCNKYPYFDQPRMAGAYMPNPYHQPQNKVRIATRSGFYWARVITERVPEKYADLPQYQSGQWSFIEGFRPA